MPLSEESRQQAVSKQFLRLHKDDFAACEANAAIIADYMEQNRLPWTLDSLEIAYEVVKDRLAPVAKSSAELAAENAALDAKIKADARAAIEAEAIASLPGHGIAGIPQFTTVAEIHQLPKEEYRRLYHSNAFGELFRARVNEVYARSGKKYVMGKF
jgi:hypothetical protein